MDLSKCQIFTPIKTVSFMLDKIGYINQVYGKRIIDNSCGNGNILIEVVRRFIADGKKRRNSKEKIKKALEQCIIGCDVDAKLVQECITNLESVANKEGIRHVNWSILQCDGLYFSDGQLFDYVVGNPPYVSYLDLDKEIRKKTRENFLSCSLGKFDYSYAFIEKGINLLKESGKMVIIAPSNMFKTVYGKKLREIIKHFLTEIIDCSALNIFQDVLTSPAISIYDKDTTANIVVYREAKKDQPYTEKVLEKKHLVDKWNFTNYVQSGERRFGDFYKVANCIATLANDVFVHTLSSHGKLDVDIEDGILRTAKSPKSEKFGKQQKIIFPYYYDDNGLRRYTQSEMACKFPKALAYLESRRAILDKRNSDNSAEWYEYGRSQALCHLNSQKLLVSSIITKRVIVYKLQAEEIPYSGIYITAKDEESLDSAMLILQTKRFYQYLVSRGIKISGDSIRISSKDIEEYTF